MREEEIQMSHSGSTLKLPAIIAASTAGTLIEWYDFFLFGSLATIIANNFFPADNPTASFLATLATFSAGLVIRPLGAIIFGRLGDKIGRKYTFMVTLSIMGFCTIGMGFVPGYNTIGYFAPLIVLFLRLLQGLALGGEYGGAAVYIAEHAPERKRGLFTSWIQSTSGFAFVLSVIVILIIKSLMQESAWISRGWRLPFILSAPLIAISIYIRNKMAESPLFAKAKEEGKISQNPLKESFRKKENLKKVLLAFFGLTLGGGVIGWITFYAQSFFLKTLSLDYNQANTIIIAGILLGIPFFFLFGWLSDKIGRKGIMVAGMAIGMFSFRPIFEKMHDIVIYQTPGRKVVSIFQKSTNPNPSSASSQIITTQKLYSDGNTDIISAEKILSNGHEQTKTNKTVRVSKSRQWKLISLIFILQLIFTMAYAPLGAYMVELFPLKIRYTSISLPYHFGMGIFGGLAPYFAAYLVNKASLSGKENYFLAGINYSVIVTAISVIVSIIYLTENNSRFSLRIVSSRVLNSLRKWLGIAWILSAILSVWFGIVEIGIPRLLSGRQEDAVFGAILTFIITPVFASGLWMFGVYALKNEYSETDYE